MPRFRHIDFSFEIKDPWWIKAEIAGYRLSQYDEFWESVIVRGAFRTDLDRAANGEVVKVPLHDIKQYGDRNAWSGNVCVQGDTIVPHSRGHSRRPCSESRQRVGRHWHACGVA